jgi:hypothetical protein
LDPYECCDHAKYQQTIIHQQVILCVYRWGSIEQSLDRLDGWIEDILAKGFKLIEGRLNTNQMKGSTLT